MAKQTKQRSDQSDTKPASRKTTAEAPRVPKEWPGTFGLYKYSKAAVMVNLQTLVVLFVANFVVSLGLGALGDVGTGLSYIFAAIFGVALTLVYFAGCRDKTMSLKQVLEGLEPMLIIKYFINGILTAVIMVASLFALVIPFFFVFPRLLLASYLVVDKAMGPIEALVASWHLTKGHSWDIWGIVGAYVLMLLPIFTIIGIPVAIYFVFMYGAALPLASIYFAKNKPATP